MSQPVLYFVNDQADEQAALAAGIPASQLRYTGVANPNAALGNGDQAPTDLQTGSAGASGIFVGNAANQAPAGAQTITGANRAQTQTQLAAQASTQAAQTSAQQNQLSADGVMHSILDPLGLDSLSQWALNMYAQSSDWNYVASQLPTTPQFQVRFPAWGKWQSEGGTAASYVSYENTVNQLAHQENLTPGLINQDTITNFINNGVSASEVQQRFQDATKAATGLDPNSEAYLRHQELGLTTGDLASIFIDPKQALPLLEQKLAGAQIGGAALNAGINIDTGLAGNLVNAGVSQSQAQSGFAAISNQQQLYSALPGQRGPSLDQTQQANAQFGLDPNAAQQVKNTAQQRLAAFQTGGAYASNSQGFVGAGTSRGA